MCFLLFLRRAVAYLTGFFVTPTKQSPWTILSVIVLCSQMANPWASWQDILGYLVFLTLVQLALRGLHDLTRDQGVKS